MTPEKLAEICTAVDAVMLFSEQNRKLLMQAEKYTRAQLSSLGSAGALRCQVSHTEIIRIGELEAEAEQISDQLESWSRQKAAAMHDLEVVVGLEVRRTVSPEVQALVQALAKVTTIGADGKPGGLSLRYIALACGLSEGTVSKLRSDTYPASSFPSTVKVGRRGARR